MSVVVPPSRPNPRSLAAIFPLAAGLLVLLLGGCGEEPPQEELPQAVPLESVPLDRQVPTRSRWLDVATIRPDASLAAPPTIRPRWDFSGRETLGYVYTHQVDSRQESGVRRPGQAGPSVMAQSLSGKGMIDISPQGDGTADYLMRDLEMALTLRFGDQTRTKSSPQPDTAVRGVSETGAGEFEQNQMVQVLRYLFPVADVELVLDQPTVVGRRMPVNANGTSVWLNGSATLTYLGLIKEGGRDLAVIRQELALDDLDLPPGIEGEVTGSLHGTGYHLFDPDRRVFQSSRLAIVMALYANVPTAALANQDMDATILPERMESRLVSDSYAKVTLAEQ